MPPLARWILVASILFVSGCNSPKLDTGSIDYRPMIEPDGKDASMVNFRYYTPPGAESLAEADRIITKGASVGVKLLQAFICDFAEGENYSFLGVPIPKRITARNAAREDRCAYYDSGQITRNTQGEVAVLATVFEMGGDRKIEFTKDLAPNEARIVYYDDDVRETGQFLNLSNLPIYGPVTYDGRPLYLKLMIIELDEDELQAQGSLLSELARLGGQAYPPGSPLLGALEDIGGVFFAQNGNDLEFRYDMIFDGEGTQTSSHAPLAWGNYVFVRQWDRSKAIPWEEFYLNHTDGRLYYRCRVALLGSGDKALTNCTPPGESPSTPIPKKSNEDIVLGQAGEEYRQYTYFVVKITKNESALQQDVYQTLGDFRAQSEEEIDLSTLKEHFETLGARVSRNALYDDLRSALPILKNPPDSSALAAQTWDKFAQALCKPLAGEENDYLTLDGAQAEYLLRNIGKHQTGSQAAKLTVSALPDCNGKSGAAYFAHLTTK